MSRTWWQLLQVMKRLWFRATAYAFAAVITAVIGILIGPYLPDALSDFVGAEAVDAILSIIASSMLTVTTFSLSTLVSATSAAATSGTPRAISLLLQDRTAQSALSTFLGAFLFSLVGLIALNTHLYGGGGRLVLFAVTLVVVILIVAMLLRWIDHLAGLGQVGETITRVSDVTDRALMNHARDPDLGGAPPADPPEGAIPLFPSTTGHLRHIDMGRLNSVAEECKGTVYLQVRPGDYCFPGEPVLMFAGPDGFGEDEEDTKSSLLWAFTVGDTRSYDQDPLFGLTVLSEIASRALSPGINDPGTAIDVVSRVTRLMVAYVETSRARVKALEEAEPEDKDYTYPHVHIPPITMREFIETAYTGTARDGAEMIEVATAVQQSLAVVIMAGNDNLAEAARAMAQEAMERSHDALTYEGDWKKLEAIHASVMAKSPDRWR